MTDYKPVWDWGCCKDVESEHGCWWEASSLVSFHYSLSSSCLHHHTGLPRNNMALWISLFWTTITHPPGHDFHGLPGLVELLSSVSLCISYLLPPTQLLDPLGCILQGAHWLFLWQRVLPVPLHDLHVEILGHYKPHSTLQETLCNFLLILVWITECLANYTYITFIYLLVVYITLKMYHAKLRFSYTYIFIACTYSPPPPSPDPPPNLDTLLPPDQIVSCVHLCSA